MAPGPGEEGSARTGKETTGKRSRSSQAATRKRAGRKATKPTSPQAAQRARKPRRAAGKIPPAPSGKLDVDPDVLEFIDALDRYRHAHERPFPSWSEVLHVLRWLGYRKP